MATQRHYRAPCPGCGAPVEFHSAQSTHAVCAYCQSTVVRSGEVLSRLGKMAEVFDDHSPLQLQASGRITLDGQPQRFTLVGRLQWHAEAGRWTEWYALLDDGSTATLSEDNGAYVFTRPLAAQRNLPDAPRFVVGSTTAINGKRYSVAANLQAQLLAAQGELPKLPALGQPCTLVELRSEDGEVLAIDYSSQPPHLEHGRAVRLEALEMSGLRDAADKDERARQFDCPHCGAPVQVQLDTTQSCTCPSCASLIDLRLGIGGELRAALQDEPVRPSIALGKVGRFEGVDWQVVGFQHRMGQEAGDDEQFGWDEYLLFNRQRGFIFLVDATDGWSLVRPTTGAPKYKNGAEQASYLGKNYQLQSRYRAETTYVLGEFYWPVQRGQRTDNIDFASTQGRGLLSREATGSEVTWSSGEKIDSQKVAAAFGMQEQAKQLQRDDVGPFVSAKGIGCLTWVLIGIVIVVLLIVLTRCDSGSSSSGYTRSSGGSWGGSSSGGGHK